MKTLMTEADGGKSDESENPVRLGELLLAEGLLTPAQLEEALLLLLLTMDDPDSDAARLRRGKQQRPQDRVVVQ